MPERDTFTTFYSWQSDLEGRSNRNLIEDALTKAAKTLRADDSLRVEPVIDRDTAGAAGAPDIATTIFAKIDMAHAFVADVSFITPPAPEEPSRKRCPNPNVLFELGFALHRLGWSRIVLVFNEHYGAVNDLPFDLRGKRVITYTSAPEDTDRATPRRLLHDRFVDALRPIALAPAPPEDTVIDRAISAVSSAQSARRSELRAATADIFSRLATVAPDLAKDTPDTAAFVNGLDAATRAIADYHALAAAAALHDDREAVEVLLLALEPIAAGYNIPRGFSGVHWPYQFEYWSQVGYELVLGLVAMLLRERRFETLAEALRTRLRVPNGPGYAPDQVRLTYLNPRTSFHASMWGQSTRGGSKRYVSAIGQLLTARYTEPPLDRVVGVTELQAADLLFTMWSSCIPVAAEADWTAYAAVLKSDPPRFLTDAIRVGPARQLAQTLGFASPEALRDFVVDQLPRRLKIPFGDSAHYLSTFEFPNAHRIGSEA
jgi:hypothetical protein